MPNRLVKTPIYQQLNLLLREELRSGQYRNGQQFLTERQICERFGVSRATANKALSNLVAEGMLEFKKGVGTFVRGSALQYDASTLVSFTDKAIAAGKTPSTQVLRFECVRATATPPVVADYLRLHAGEDVYFVERLRLADNIPVIFERRFIVARRCPGLQATDLEGSLYAIWSHKYGLAIGGADETIRAVMLRGQEVKRLQIGRVAAGFLVLSTGFLVGGEPLWWEQTWYRGDLYEFHNRLGPVQTARPATGALRNA
jgi:GntR family transcriptional regulator